MCFFFVLIEGLNWVVYSLMTTRKRKRVAPTKGDIKYDKEKDRWVKYNGKGWICVCYDCHKTEARYGYMGDVNKITCRWCAKCKIKHGDDILMYGEHACKNCRKKAANFGIPDKNGTVERTWCSECKKKVEGSVAIATRKRKRNGDTPMKDDVKHDKENGRWLKYNGKSWTRVCDDCHEAQAWYGHIGENDKVVPQWCIKCKEEHGDNVFLSGKGACRGCRKLHATFGVPDDDGKVIPTWCMKCKTDTGDENAQTSHVKTQCKYPDCKSKGVNRKGPKKGFCELHGGPSCTIPGCKSKARIDAKFCGLHGLPPCEIQGCTSRAQSGGVCAKHGAKSKCTYSGCTSIQIFREGGQRGFCKAHGGVPFCIMPECTARSTTGLLCASHNAPKCLASGCTTPSQKGVYCRVHHPNFIPTVRGYSKESCNFMDLLERELKVSIQHYHYDFASGDVSGSEKCCIPGDKRHKVDGFIALDDLNKRPKLQELLKHRKKSVAFEYQGPWHGHPSMWVDLEPKEQKSHHLFPKWIKDLRKWKKCEENGTKVYYIQYEDFREWKKHSVGTSLMSICRQASGHFPYLKEHDPESNEDSACSVQ